MPIDTAALYSYAKNDTVYTVGPFDRIDLSVWSYPDLSRNLLVKEDGTVFVPNAGHVPIGGLTLRQAQNKLTTALSVVFDNPQIDLNPVEVRSKRYYVVGEVKLPGGYPIFKPLTVREAISLAGGTTEYSLLESTYLSRGGKVYPIDVYSMLTASGNEVYLHADDVLYIPSKSTATVAMLTTPHWFADSQNSTKRKFWCWDSRKDVTSISGGTGISGCRNRKDTVRHCGRCRWPKYSGVR